MATKKAKKTKKLARGKSLEKQRPLKTPHGVTHEEFTITKYIDAPSI